MITTIRFTMMIIFFFTIRPRGIIWAVELFTRLGDIYNSKGLNRI